MDTHSRERRERERESQRESLRERESREEIDRKYFFFDNSFR